MTTPGRKDDAGKIRWRLLPLGPLEEVVEVLDFGAQRYGVSNWQKVEHAKERYTDALWRHFTAWQRGQKRDADSGYHHLAHVVCCALFLLWFEGVK